MKLRSALIHKIPRQHSEERAKSIGPERSIAISLRARARGKTARIFRTVLLCAGVLAQATHSHGAPSDEQHNSAIDSSVKSVNPVVQWNRTLLAIVRTHGAQPPTIHPTRSFAIMHAAIYDAVNAIDRSTRLI